MGFVFRLQGYLDIKQKLEKQKEMEYAKALGRLNEALAELERLKDGINQNILEMKGEIKNTFSPYTIKTRRMYIRNLENRTEKQKKLVSKLRDEAEKKRLELVEAVKDRKILEKLRENALEEYHIEENKKAGLAIDEIVSYKNSRRKENG